jgi:hypothetical protein
VIPAWDTTRLTTTAVLALAVTMVGCAAAGLVVTQRTDSRMAIGRHGALEEALAELRIVFGDVERMDIGQL